VGFGAPRLDLPGRGIATAALDLILEPGSRQVLLGRSGSGKSLLSRLVLGLVPPLPATAGGVATVSWEDGEEQAVDLSRFPAGDPVPLLASLRGNFFGYLPQGGRENLVPGWSLARHVEVLCQGSSELADASYEGMAQLGLDPGHAVRDAFATQLSEGMIRRALLAICVALPTSVLIADEPTTGLDPASRATVIGFLGQALRNSGRGLLLTTHDLQVARSLGTRFFHVESGRLAAVADRLEGEDSPFASFLEAEAILGLGVG
jgi:ABC-type glutathione transport system ATPase component